MLAKEAEATEGEEEHPTGIPLAEMTPLRRFLEQASLANDVTDDDDDKENSVSLGPHAFARLSLSRTLTLSHVLDLDVFLCSLFCSRKW